jgi:hypothetical protein
MSRYFTHYWDNKTWEDLRVDQHGDVLDYIGGNQFRRRGLQPEDHVYVITVITGQLYLLGKLVIGDLGDIDTIAQQLNTTPAQLWSAADHIRASAATPMDFERRVPLELTEQLRFHSDSATRVVFKSPGHLDTQTMRSVRELTPESAQLLDSILSPLQMVSYTDARIGDHTGGREEIDLSDDEEAALDRVWQQRDGMHVMAREFARYFAHWKIELPNDDLEERRRGTLHAEGWQIQYLFGADTQGEYLDFYAAHRMTNASHHRIYATGQIEDLPTMQEYRIFPPNASPEDEARIEREYSEHNRAIGALLREKGFH